MNRILGFLEGFIFSQDCRPKPQHVLNRLHKGDKKINVDKRGSHCSILFINIDSSKLYYTKYCLRSFKSALFHSNCWLDLRKLSVSTFAQLILATLFEK